MQLAMIFFLLFCDKKKKKQTADADSVSFVIFRFILMMRSF